MSDSLNLINRILSRDKVEIPRLFDLMKQSNKADEERDPSEIIANIKSKADNLRG